MNVLSGNVSSLTNALSSLSGTLQGVISSVDILSGSLSTTITDLNTLSGIVINNAIVLLERIKTEEQNGFNSYDAISVFC